MHLWRSCSSDCLRNRRPLSLRLFSRASYWYFLEFMILDDPIAPPNRRREGSATAPAFVFSALVLFSAPWAACSSRRMSAGDSIMISASSPRSFAPMSSSAGIARCLSMRFGYRRFPSSWSIYRHAGSWRYFLPPSFVLVMHLYCDSIVLGVSPSASAFLCVPAGEWSCCPAFA